MTTQSLPSNQPRRSPLFWRDTIQGYLFILPVVLGLTLFVFGPMVASFYFSLTEYSVLKAPEFIGWRNYVDMFTRPQLRVLQSLWVTIFFALTSVPLTMAAALGAAVLLNQRLRGMRIFRTMLYIPTIVPVVATVFVWGWLLNPDKGLVNASLQWLGLPTYSWLSEPATALPTLIILSVWGIGGTMVIFLAGLQGVPETLYEAGRLDGANAPRLFWHITLPQITPTIFFVLITGLIGTFQYFVPAFILTKGGPLYATYFYNLNLYEKAFRWQFMGLASAMAWLMFAIILILTLILFRSSDAWVHYEVKR
ncbi:MAG: sugar ABC transporter permease [Caldilineaceae bacterium]|nr:sugar ABC transporter permease [Caldilineaceae bacterium]